MSTDYYVSSYGLGHKRIDDTILALVDSGIRHIELTGGSDHYQDLELQVLSLQQTYGLHFRCHNYFPPPKTHFVLNLASLDDSVFNASVEHCERALDFSKQIGAKTYGVHAGFLIDIRLDELGKAIESRELFDRSRATLRFLDTVKSLAEYAQKLNINLFIENNVINQRTLCRFGNQNPLLASCAEDIFELQRQFPFELLLDLAHLKVSANSLGLDFKEECNKLIQRSNYLHLSDNDGLEDSNQSLRPDSEMVRILKSYDIGKKTKTIEIYSGLSGIRQTLETLQNLGS
jgi:sugar phosphate isomerase/epimerase